MSRRKPAIEGRYYAGDDPRQLPTLGAAISVAQSVVNRARLEGRETFTVGVYEVGRTGPLVRVELHEDGVIYTRTIYAPALETVGAR